MQKERELAAKEQSSLSFLHIKGIFAFQTIMVVKLFYQEINCYDDHQNSLPEFF